MSLLDRITSNLALLLRRPPLQQYAALCYRMDATAGLQVLLLTSRETRRWVIPKGWPMKKKKPHAVAEREAYEEAGVSGKADKQAFGFFTYLKRRKSGLLVPVRVQVHTLCVEAMLEDFPEKGTRDLEWVSCDEAAKRVRESGLSALFLEFSRRFSPPAQPKMRAVGH
ncbi:NUDIX hydrolase [Rhizobium sp. SSA_523]|uniref:NUDIX hydrolase n=1 Tax=Rhizobium sp. SSA_523 TaxID=2952477 RepID=UPI002090CF62|nr:NUDIX hydrolase [Rhizobium sp. SSA_523]MCO5733160.1 NUDIX hydrolase [Rhizobium sp. SSA_523]WKC24032.1 NUDIX hydrolase [Rhizobium sp. SSA_523]